jgi:hypothetical protein
MAVDGALMVWVWPRRLTRTRTRSSFPGTSVVDHPTRGDRDPQLGQRPSRFLTDRAEAEHAYQLAEQPGSINVAAQELGTTWPSLRKTLQRHGLGVPARKPKRSSSGRSRRPGSARAGRPPEPGPVLWRSTVTRFRSGRSGGELAERVRRAEDHAVLGAWVVVELHSESHASKPSTRVWAITRRAQRAYRRHDSREQRGERRQADRASRTDRPHRPQERGMVADAR